MSDEKRIYETLEEEHLILTTLCEKFRASQDRGERTEILTELRRRLTAYLQATHATLYAALRKFEEARELIDDCEMEHEQLRQLMEQLRAAQSEDQQRQHFNAFFEVLHDHIEQQEGELFPFARGYLSPLDAVRLVLLFEEESERLLDD